MEFLDKNTEKDWNTLSNLLVGNWTTQTIGAAVRLGIIETLLKHPMKLTDIIDLLKLEENACQRLLRALVGLKLLRQLEGTFSLTDMGQILAKNHKWSLAAPSLFWSEEHYNAWEGLSTTIRSGKPHFENIYGKQYFQWLSDHPEKGKLYHRTLESYAEHDYVFIPEFYDFSQHQTVMDVGGGSGTLLTNILQSCPTIKGILLERPEVVSLARKKLSSQGLEDRYEVIEGDFFERIPKKSDVIILAKVLHDWNNSQVKKILKQCYNALPKKGRLLVIELLLPTKIGSSFGALLNLNMLVITGGKERTQEEYKTLIQESGFNLIEVISTPSVSTIIIAEKS